MVKQMTKKYLIFITFIFVLFLNGCYSYDDVSKTLFVNTIALDYDSENSEYIIYYHMTNPSSLTTASLGGGGSQTSPFSMAKGTGKTFFEAMELISDNSNKKIKLTHVQTVIFTMNYLNYDNLLSFHEFIKTTPTLHSDFGILVTDSKIEDIFKIADIEDTSPYYSIIVSSNDANKSHKIVSFLEFSQGITEDYITISFPFIRTFKGIWETQDNEITSLNIVGDIYINKENDIIMFEERKYPILNLINTDENTDITIDDISYYITKHNVKIKHINNNDFKVKIVVEAYITKYKNVTNEEAKDIFIKEMSDSLNELINLTKDNNIDLFSVNDMLYRKSKLKSALFYKDANFICEFDVRLISTL